MQVIFGIFLGIVCFASFQGLSFSYICSLSFPLWCRYLFVPIERGFNMSITER